MKLKLIIKLKCSVILKSKKIFSKNFHNLLGKCFYLISSASNIYNLSLIYFNWLFPTKIKYMSKTDKVREPVRTAHPADRRCDRQTDRQADRLTDSQTDRQTNK